MTPATLRFEESVRDLRIAPGGALKSLQRLLEVGPEGRLCGLCGIDVGQKRSR